MKKRSMTWSFLVLSLLGFSSASAAGYPWKNHAAPYNATHVNIVASFPSCSSCGM